MRYRAKKRAEKLEWLERNDLIERDCCGGDGTE